MSKITISLRLEKEKIELLKISAMQEGLRRGNFNLNYINLIEEAIDECYSAHIFQEAKKYKESIEIKNEKTRLDF